MRPSLFSKVPPFDSGLPTPVNGLPSTRVQRTLAMLTSLSFAMPYLSRHYLRACPTTFAPLVPLAFVHQTGWAEFFTGDSPWLEASKLYDITNYSHTWLGNASRAFMLRACQAVKQANHLIRNWLQHGTDKYLIPRHIQHVHRTTHNKHLGRTSPKKGQLSTDSRPLNRRLRSGTPGGSTNYWFIFSWLSTQFYFALGSTLNRSRPFIA
jgi:hypothetical protein